MVEVIQADRDRAASCLRQLGQYDSDGCIPAGEHDTHYLVQAFAAHRIEAERDLTQKKATP